MDIMSSAFLLFLGLTTLVANQPTYEIDNFYTYDRQHKQQPLLLQSKVFVPRPERFGMPTASGKATEVYLSKCKKIGGLKIERLRTPHLTGWVVSFDNNRLAIDFMSKLAKDGIPHSPLVKWDGMYSIPSNTLIIQAKPFVTEKLIRQRLEKSAKVKILNLENIKGNQWSVEISDVIVPPNILVLANMISEDTAWVDWARVVFTPVHSHMSGTMNITTAAALNLGYDKQLNVVITVYKPSVKIRKDLLPKLGQNIFVPGPQKDEVWYDFGPTTVTEEVTPEKTVIKMTSSFRFLTHGKISIPQIQVAFDDDKVQGTFMVPGLDYSIQSVIGGTEIDDIQAMPVFPSVANSPAPAEFTRVALPWRVVGLAGGLFGLVAMLLVGGAGIVRRLGDLTTAMDVWQGKKKLWTDLKASVIPRLCTEENWREVYKNANNKLTIVLAAFYNINVPISADSTENPILANILRELEKLYSQDATPDAKKLASDISVFVREAK